MKKFLLSMLLLIVGIPSFAQKGQIELSLYGGSLSYHKTENSYYGTFSSGFELGFQSKYFLTNLRIKSAPRAETEFYPYLVATIL